MELLNNLRAVANDQYRREPGQRILRQREWFVTLKPHRLQFDGEPPPEAVLNETWDAIVTRRLLAQTPALPPARPRPVTPGKRRCRTATRTAA